MIPDIYLPKCYPHSLHVHNALHVCKGRLFTAAGCVLLVQCHLVVDGLQSTLRDRCCCRVTGRGYMDVNRISGYIPGKIVFFLMQVRFYLRFPM